MSTQLWVKCPPRAFSPDEEGLPTESNVAATVILMQGNLPVGIDDVEATLWQCHYNVVSLLDYM